MTCRKMSFFEIWRSKKERGALLERANGLRLLSSQLKQLLGDNGVRAKLQNARMASLLPPTGTEMFRRFTPASLGEIQRQEAKKEEQKKREKNKEVKKEQPRPASHLEAGKSLPFVYGDPPPELLNTPLEELDPFYQSQMTFIVLGKGNMIHRFNAEPACYLLSPFNPLRKAAIKILINSFFSLFIMVTILTNCVFMSMSDPPLWTNTVERVFTAIYTFEAIIKIVSRGFCVGNSTFLSDAWNWLDVVVVSTSYLTEFVGLGKFSVLRTVPCILKIITVIPGLRTTAGALVQSLKRLAGVIVLVAFGLSILAVISLQLFMGGLQHKCVLQLSLSNLTFDSGDIAGYYGNKTERINFDFNKYLSSAENHYFLPGHTDALLCGNFSDAGVCPEGFVCMKSGTNPNYGYSNFDSFGWSLLAAFRLLTQDFWENLMLMTLRARGKVFVTFFALIVFPSCFFLLSLLVAVFAMASIERVEAGFTEARQKEEEFNQILDVLKKREEEEQATCRTELSEKQEGIGDQRSCSPCWFSFANFLLRWNCCGCWRQLKQQLHAIITNPLFELTIIICIILNIIYMAVVHYPMTYQFERHLNIAELVFTVIFTVEMILKLVALDPYGYFQVSWNIFDSFLVAISLLFMFDFPWCLILMRVLRLARWWPSFHLFMKIVWTSVRALRNPTVLLLIMVFIFSVVGMQLFQKDYKDCVCRIAFDCQLPRWHMADFFHSFLIIFQVLCGQWIEHLWDCMEVSGQATCLIFFMVVVIVGNLLVLNLFLTLLLSSFSSDSLQASERKEKHNLDVIRGQKVSWNKTCILEHIWTLMGKKNHVDQDDTAVDIKKDNRKEYLALNFVTSDQPVSEVKALSGHHDNLTSDYQLKSANIPTAEIEIKTPEKENKKHREVKQDRDDEDKKGNMPEDCCGDNCYRCCPFLNIDTSQGSGRVWYNLRRACFVMVQHKYFEVFFIIIIILSSAALVFEDVYLQQRQILKMVVETADQVFTYLFLLEMLLKWIAFGLKKYFTDAWCWLEFLILDVYLVSLMACVLGFSELGAIQFLRTLRALGPLRALSRFQNLRVVVQALVQSIPSMCEVMLVALVVWLIFSILGVSLFAGKFYYCFNETSEEIFPPEVVNNKSQCFSLIEVNFTEVHWKNLKFNFDNVGNGYLSLLHLAASADWMDIMYAAVDSTQVESQLVYENNLYISLYFICFIIIGSFFTLNFFIRFVINNLQREKLRGRHMFVTEGQQQHSKAMKMQFSKEPRRTVPRPQNRCQAWLFDLVTHPYFEVFMVVLICLNMVVLMVETDQQSMEKDLILCWLHFLFINLFLIELILKIIALRQHYFRDGLNILDFVVITMSIFGMFLADLSAKYFISPTLFPILRLLRIGRVLHLIRCASGIQKLLLAVKMSLPALLNIGLLFFLITFTFSIFGMFNFAYVKKEALIDDIFNFETFGNSMICMFMVTTRAGWSGLLIPIMNTPLDCDPDIENPEMVVSGNCGSPGVAIVFFSTYIMLSFVLLVHMYIIIILETFSLDDTDTLCDNDLQMFYATWKKFDPDASQFIQYNELSDFCHSLQDPLRIPKPNTIKLIHMDLPLFPGDKIHCMDVLHALAQQVLGESAEMGSIKARMEEMLNMSKVSCEPISSTLRRKQEEVAATVIQRAYRRGLLQHGDAKEMAVVLVDEGSGDSGV